jgi:hypothetical protein
MPTNPWWMGLSPNPWAWGLGAGQTNKLTLLSSAHPKLFHKLLFAWDLHVLCKKIVVTTNLMEKRDLRVFTRQFVSPVSPAEKVNHNNEH